MKMLRLGQFSLLPHNEMLFLRNVAHQANYLALKSEAIMTVKQVKLA